ncbi:MAG: PD-(D/E)XK nuclease family protein [Kiritimatiellales bacterium]|nr:PD-(D/E)XK nuclease family protein [Kiritimatiellota bacterium]MBL7012236.1 PD-(D/E)XK nuclease family protein [Kiritimatiellales bacterium]
MKMSNGALTIFPTELAKRRAERNAVLKAGAIDTSRLFTQKKLMDTCERAARRTGLLAGRAHGEAEMRLLLEQTAENVRFTPRQPIARLSPAARADLLKQLIEKLAFLAEDSRAVTEWLLAHEPEHKLHGLGQLLDAWRAQCSNMGLADRFAINTALLQLIESGDLPAELDGEIHFRAVRWFNPFEERFAAALKTRLGTERVQIFSVLPGEHAQAAGDRLCARVRADLGNEEEWKQWAEDFADAYEADDSNILEKNSRERVSCFVSAHPYGEIEDAARRIAAEIEHGNAPDQMALILRDLSPYTDIVPDVFQRFGIPYYFRRGTPAAAHPPVKALLALLAFPHNHSRDRLCDLLLSPSIDWPGVEDRGELVAQIRQTEPPRLRRLPKELRDFFQSSEFSEQVQFLIKQHHLELPEEVHSLIQEIALLPALPMERMISLFEKLLDNVTLNDELSTESGVWIVNPMDAAGLRFESVYIAGMDDRTFPQIPKADSLFNAAERNALRAFLEERNIPCPRLALSETGEALIQEEILFLTALSAATEKLTLSYTQSDADGKERAPGEFFERMRGLSKIDAPAHGESFHTILPPEAVRAEDEARQTQAWLNPSPATIQTAITPLPALQKWLEKNPEFSATALESLARNRFVFFLEKVLGIKPDRTHGDDTDPMDRGSIVHDILERVYAAVAERSDWYAKKVSNHWKLSQEGEIPLAVFDPAKADELLALARGIAEEEFAKAERRASCHLGHRAVWETEKRKLHQVIENIVRMDINTAQAENRYPALFEMKFDEKHDLPITLHYTQGSTQGSVRESCIEDDTIPRTDPIRFEEGIRLKGKIDRIDLIFDDDGELQQLLVVDYKGKSRIDTAETIAKKTALNLDCQLALYTFAAQQFFFGEHNTPELNEKVQAVYHLQERDLEKMSKHFGNDKKRLVMTPELTEQFLETLFSNVWKLRNGDLAPEPLIEGYDDYSHICRTPAIDPKELLK